MRGPLFDARAGELGLVVVARFAVLSSERVSLLLREKFDFLLDFADIYSIMAMEA